MTRYYDASSSNAFSIIQIGFLDFMDIHQWFWVFRNDVNFNRDDVDRNFAMRVWQVEHTLNIVLNYSISNKICFNVSNAPLKMIRIIC